MGRPYSQDLRERVVAAAATTSRRQAAARFRVGIATSIRWMLQRLMTSRGDHRPKISRVSPMRNAAIRRDPGANHSQGE